VVAGAAVVVAGAAVVVVGGAVVAGAAVVVVGAAVAAVASSTSVFSEDPVHPALTSAATNTVATNLPTSRIHAVCLDSPTFIALIRPHALARAHVVDVVSMCVRARASHTPSLTHAPHRAGSSISA
jgi:NAD(P)H-hydrate repair Nnr-like enzyme with NAD(P)H-hydrate dehydratase domain